MSSADCTMGLRSFLLHEDSAHCTSRPTTYCRSPKAAEFATQMSELGPPSMISNGHADEAILMGDRNPCIDGATQRRRQPPMVSKRNHFTQPQHNHSVEPNYSGMEPFSNHHRLSNVREENLSNGASDVGTLHHHHHHYQTADHKQVNGFVPVSNSCPSPSQGAEEALANGHGPHYHSSSSSSTKSQPSSSTFPTANLHLGGRSVEQQHSQLVEMECRIRKGKSLARQDENIHVKYVPPHEEISQKDVQGEEEDDNEVSETLLKSIAALPKIVVPTKFQVLNYVANAKSLQIRRTGSELQVTDSTGFPLLDVWLKSSCFRKGSSWVMESYGRTVLLMTDMEKSWWGSRRSAQPPLNPSKQQQGVKTNPLPAQIGGPSTSATNPRFSSKSTLQVLTPESETLGYFIVGDPFVLQNHERKCIAKFLSGDQEDPNILSHGSPLSNNKQTHSNHSTSIMPNRHLLYQCLLEGNGQEIGCLETHPSHCKFMQLNFGAATAMAFPLKLLVLASAVRLAAAISSMAVDEEKKHGQADHTIKLAYPTHTLQQGGQDCCTIV